MNTGDRTAWLLQNAKGVVTGWSCAHRVFRGSETYCSRAIPERAVTSWNSNQKIETCGRCERMHANVLRHQTENEALKKIMARRGAA